MLRRGASLTGVLVLRPDNAAMSRIESLYVAYTASVRFGMFRYVPLCPAMSRYVAARIATFPLYVAVRIAIPARHDLDTVRRRRLASVKGL